MNTVRTLLSAASGARSIVLAAAATLVLIAGLLAMHTLTSGHDPGHAVAGTAASGAVHDDGAAAAIDDGAAGAAHAGDVRHCPRAGCGALMPDHAMLMAACVLVLLSTAIVLIAPALLRTASITVVRLLARERAVLDALAPPRPPCLHVLSISRT